MFDRMKNDKSKENTQKWHDDVKKKSKFKWIGFSVLTNRSPWMLIDLFITMYEHGVSFERGTRKFMNITSESFYSSTNTWRDNVLLSNILICVSQLQLIDRRRNVDKVIRKWLNNRLQFHLAMTLFSLLVLLWRVHVQIVDCEAFNIH